METGVSRRGLIADKIFAPAVCQGVAGAGGPPARRARNPSRRGPDAALSEAPGGAGSVCGHVRPGGHRRGHLDDPAPRRSPDPRRRSRGRARGGHRRAGLRDPERLRAQRDQPVREGPPARGLELGVLRHQRAAVGRRDDRQPQRRPRHGLRLRPRRERQAAPPLRARARRGGRRSHAPHRRRRGGPLGRRPRAARLRGPPGLAALPVAHRRAELEPGRRRPRLRRPPLVRLLPRRLRGQGHRRRRVGELRPGRGRPGPPGGRGRRPLAAHPRADPAPPPTASTTSASPRGTPRSSGRPRRRCT
jgi:hypothetical protein